MVAKRTLMMIIVPALCVILTSFLYFSVFNAESSEPLFVKRSLEDQNSCNFSGEVNSGEGCVLTLYGNLFENSEDAEKLFNLKYTFEVTGISGGSDKGR